MIMAVGLTIDFSDRRRSNVRQIQCLKWSCEAGGSPDETRLEQTPYTQLIWRYLGIK